MSSDNDDKRQQFGTRYLTDNADVFQHNAWDNVVWDEEQEKQAVDMVNKQMEGKMNDTEAEVFVNLAAEHWDGFYGQHDNRFFKDRHWLFTEFPELSDLPSNPTYTSSSMFNILEVGCGAGNTIFPILQNNDDPALFVYACDLSPTAVDIIKGSTCYDNRRCLTFVHDISSLPSTTSSTSPITTSSTSPPTTSFTSPSTKTTSPLPFSLESLDIILFIFTLSALHPKNIKRSVNHLCKYLKPGGIILFRDYGRYDMAQLRFKPARCISENFYARGDGTQCYFFTQDEVDDIFTSSGLFKEQNIVDRRLQVNRGRKLKMYRVWIQCKYRKPTQSTT